MSIVGITLGVMNWRTHPLALALVSGTLLCLIGLGLWRPAWGFEQPLSWILLGRRECYAIALAGPMLLWGLLHFIRSAVLRGVLIFALAGVVILFGYLPVAAVFWGESAALKMDSKLDANGVCHQSTGITCGPAATVTVLHRFGMNVTEREVALACGTSSCGGTAADLIAQTLRDQLGDQLRVELRAVDSLKDLPPIGKEAERYGLAIVKLTSFVDHCVALLDLNETEVTIGDPMSGLRKIPAAEFSQMWKGIVVIVTHN